MKSSTSLWTPSQLISSSYTQQQPARSKQWQLILNRLISVLVPSTEPQITRVAQNGKLIWKVYDPQTQQRLILTSENEVRSWLESRYYSN